MKYVIVGGVAGGASAAARLRRLDEFAQIVMLERGRYVSFANCGLPYHIGGIIAERESLLVQTVDGLCSSFQLDIRVRHEVLSIDRESKQLEVKELDTGRRYKESYDSLLLSPGAQPVRPPIPGIISQRISALRSLEDMDRIITMIDAFRARRAVIVGAGFIGLEIAENLSLRGIEVTIVEKTDQVLPVLDFELAAQLHQHLAGQGIDVVLKNGVASFNEHDKGIAVKLADGSEIPADIVILSIGVKPEAELALDAGLSPGECGGIRVNEFLQTDDESIFAVGDAVEVPHGVSGKQVLIPLAWPANRQGRLAADAMTGRRKQGYSGTLGASIVRVFELTAAATGLNEKALRSLGISYRSVTVNRTHHAEYYPDAHSMTLKVLFREDGVILGAQALGYEGVDKRIDLISAAIKGSLKVWQLQDLEVAYAPPYNSAKDPVNIAGYTAENLLDGLVDAIRYDEVDHWLGREDVIPLDVRTLEEHQDGAIPGSQHIPIDELRARLEELDRNTSYLVYCQVGQRGYLASRILTQHGFKAVNLDGGYALWYPTTAI